MAKEKKSVDEKISDALEIEFEPVQEVETSIIKKENNLPISKEKMDKDLQLDYNQVRGNIKNLISTGKDAIDGILNVAVESDAPRAYEVASQMIKTVSEMNKDLIELHQKMKNINKEEIEVNSTTNNSIYVGSTRDLQDLINQSRSAKKALDNCDDIIDAEVTEIIDDN
ncbi:MAG: terminase [Proteobacteria bacterium]|nr:terminase [Pseudomonadota bacterium]